MFLDFYSGSTKTDGIVYDLLWSGKSIELKTDTYSMSSTENFFMEKYSNDKDYALGGPFRAAKDCVDYFCYLFINDRMIFWFEPLPLVNFLETYIIGQKPKEIKNVKWTTIGYTVPREDCQKLCVRQDTFNYV